MFYLSLFFDQEYPTLCTNYFLEDNYFAELKESEIIKERIETVNLMDEFVGKYYSKAWIRRNILKQNDEDIEKMDQEIKDEGGDEDDMDIDL